MIRRSLQYFHENNNYIFINPITVTILDDNFNRYDDVLAMQSAGWVTNGSATLATIDDIRYSKYLRQVPSSTITKKFLPVTLTSSGGISPGKNATLTITFDGYSFGGSGSNQGFWKFYDSTTGNVAVAAGRRAGKIGNIYYLKSIPSDTTGALEICNDLKKFTKFRFVIKITDEYGAFLAGGPKVDVYCNDMNTPVIGGTNLRLIDTTTSKIDSVQLNGSVNMEVDNLDISLNTIPIT